MRIVIYAFALLLSLSTVQAQTFTPRTGWLGQWAFAPGMAHRPTNSIYLPGTYQFGDIDQFVRYNVATDSWSTVPGLPAIKSEFGFSFNVNNRLFFGGGVDQPGTFTNVVYEFIPPNTFTPVDNVPNGPASGFSFSLGGFGYVGRGIVSGFASLNAMYRFNPAASPGSQWSVMTPYPGSGVVNMGATSLGAYGYAGLGRSNPGSTAYADWWRYDPAGGAGGTWTAMSPFPGTPRECPILAPLCGKIYLLGGWNAGTNIYFNEIWVFDPTIGALGSWSLLGNDNNVWGAQSGRYGPGTAVYGDSLFFGFGYGVSNVNSDWKLFTSCIVPLAAHNLSFEAKAISGEGIELVWNGAAADETPTYKVFHSMDGTNWNWEATTSSNRWMHPQPGNGIHYYQLQQMNENGEHVAEAFNTAWFTDAYRGMVVFPNPVRQDYTVRFDVMRSGVLTLLDGSGREIRRLLLDGQQEVRLEKGDLSSGLYWVRVNEPGGGSWVEKLLVE